jgi:hypothetical protein
MCGRVCCVIIIIYFTSYTVKKTFCVERAWSPFYVKHDIKHDERSEEICSYHILPLYRHKVWYDRCGIRHGAIQFFNPLFIFRKNAGRNERFIFLHVPLENAWSVPSGRYALERPRAVEIALGEKGNIIAQKKRPFTYVYWPIVIWHTISISFIAFYHPMSHIQTPAENNSNIFPACDKYSRNIRIGG